MKKLVWISLTMVLFILFSCNDNDNPDWEYCDGCPNSSWVGEYEGTGSYYTKNNPDETQSVSVTVSVTEPYDGQLKFAVSSEGNYYTTHTGTKLDSNYYFDLAGSTKSIHASLLKKADQYKITGISKTYTMVNDTLVVEKSLGFEAVKK